MLFKPEEFKIDLTKKKDLTMFSDLDGTLISSLDKTSDAVCVATKNNRCTSFMSLDTYNKFQELKDKLNIVPVTTRCLISYNNVKLTKGIGDALVDNGAVLVHKDGIVDGEWLEESYKLSEADRDNFNKCREILEKYGYKEKWGSDFVLDYVNRSPNLTERDKQNMEIELVRHGVGLKVKVGKTSAVVLFTILSKGNNLKRYLDKYKNIQPLISAGDTGEDETMFGSTLYSIGKDTGSATFCCSEEGMSDFVVSKSLELINSL